MTRIRRCTCAFLLAFATLASAQVAVPAVRIGSASSGEAAPASGAVPGKAVAAPGDAASSGAAKPAEAAESPRLQKLKQLAFDRRPSATLKAWAGPKGEAAPQDPLDAEMAGFQRAVTLGKWDAVKAYLAGLPYTESQAGYKQLVQSLQGAPPVAMVPGTMPQGMQFAERNVFFTDDVLGLAAAAPHGLDRDLLTGVGGVLRQSITNGNGVEHVVARLKVEVAKPAGQSLFTRRQVAQLLTTADQAAEAGAFLPALEKAAADKDLEALNLLAKHYLGLNAKETKATHLEKAWAATQGSLAAGAGLRTELSVAERTAAGGAAALVAAVPRAHLEEALRRAVELAPRLKEELGQKWLEESFTSKPERGMDILATIGALSSQGLQLQPMSPDQRLKGLQLQKTATEALLKAAPERATTWKPTLTLLANGWLKEADFSRQFDRSAGLGPRVRRDFYGNMYFVDDESPMPMYMMQQQNMPQPIRTGDMLEARPGDPWLEKIEDGLRPKMVSTYANLYLKAAEEAKAFPFIEKMAATHPDQAKDLVKEFLRVWTRNHNPNAARERTNPYMWMFGFERRADGIPLTRSKQERNLTDLAEWIVKLRKLPGAELDEELLAKAFTTCHSSAEVYRTEAIEKVFGPVGGLKPKTLAALAQQMRENLAGLWREPAEQKDKKTNRKQKDIQAEVIRGYSVARATVETALKKFPDDWALTLARAAILHDLTNFEQELAKSSDFSAKRDEALAGFARAAKLYAAKVKDLTEEDQTTLVFEQWLYASLGAVDLAQLTEEKLPDMRQPPLIKGAIKALPGEAATKHMEKFANTLFTRLSSVKPAAKFRYLRSGFDIVGEQKQALEARKVYDYYKDLVSEIKLDAVLDGSDVIGHKKPFGVFVNLRHTREIERESGGFGRYLQNQNSNMYFSYNYGRPTADYRDKFQAAATEALKEHFEVLSVTFQTDKVNSKAAVEYGWRVTPYAYLLLKPRGPQVDKLPPLRIDLDFLDTSGYVIMPIDSAAVPLDAKPELGQPRPLQKLQVTQTLDERQADQGKLLLEIKATALGLVGELEQILKLDPAEFEIVNIEDKGVSVAKFDQEADQTAVVSERMWIVSLQAKPGLPDRPAAFRFAAAKQDGTEMVYQRYADADLATATPEISLERSYGKPDRRWLWIAGSATAVVLVLAGLLVRALLRRKAPHGPDIALPDKLTPFTTLGLLQHLRKTSRLDGAKQAELNAAIDQLERHYFADEANGNGAIDLRQIAEGWISKTR